MRIPPWPRVILSALLLALVVPTAARPQEEKPNTKVQTRRATPEAAVPKAQTQTAPAAQAGKKKPQTSPGEAGFRDVQGAVVQVFPDRHALIVRTTTNDYQVFVTSETVLLRDGQPADLKVIQPGDRVESCQFNAKNVIKKMTVLGTGKAPVPQTPPPAPKP